MTSACLLLLATLAAGPTDGDSAPVRIVSYNIHHAEGLDGRLDVDRIARVLASLAPDVVCVQEVDRNLPRTRHLDMPALLAEKLGMAVVFEANYQFDGGDYGNAVLSRFPITTHRNHALPGPDGVEPRGCLEVDIGHPDGPFTVFCTHLGLRGAEREAQAAHILGLLPEGRAVVVAGDMNEIESGPAMRALLERLGDSLAGQPSTPPTFPAQAPKRRIDYILLGGGWTVREAGIIQTEETAVASDHLPCLAVVTRADP